jgi:hypothetical protein
VSIGEVRRVQLSCTSALNGRSRQMFGESSCASRRCERRPHRHEDMGSRNRSPVETDVLMRPKQPFPAPRGGQSLEIAPQNPSWARLAATTEQRRESGNFG